MHAAERVAAPFDDVLAKQRIGPNYLLVWVDTNIDENDDHCPNALAQLRKIVPKLRTCETTPTCIDHLNTMDEDRALVVVSADLGQDLIPQIVELTKLEAIYIYGGNRAHVEEWASKWAKIEGVYNSIESICQALNKVIRGTADQVIAMSFVSRTMIEEATSDRTKIDRLPPAYMYTQLFKKIVLEISDDSTEDMNKFVNHCREHGINNTELEEFKENYHRKTPVWWYTCEMFLYGMLNQALRQMEMGTLVMMGFFIRHLHQQLQQLHEEQSERYKTKFVVYRGQGCSTEDLERLFSSDNGLLSFNNFVSTSMSKNISMGFVERTLQRNADTVGVLFIMTIDPDKVSPSSTPFARIDDDTDMPDEEEVLFTMHTIFRVGGIKQSEMEDRLWEVQLTLTDDNDTQLTALTPRISEDIGGQQW